MIVNYHIVPDPHGRTCTDCLRKDGVHLETWKEHVEGEPFTQLMHEYAGVGEMTPLRRLRCRACGWSILLV